MSRIQEGTQCQAHTVQATAWNGLTLLGLHAPTSVWTLCRLLGPHNVVVWVCCPCTAHGPDSQGLVQDFLRMLPWPDYTHPLGPLNLASHLQQGFDNPPDLGPKSYVAYGRWCLWSHTLLQLCHAIEHVSKTWPALCGQIQYRPMHCSQGRMLARPDAACKVTGPSR